MELQELTVLIVDDDDISSFIAQNILLQSEIKTQSYIQPSGKSALEYLKRSENKKTPWPDLILLDINMPVVNGYQFLSAFMEFPEELRARTSIVGVSFEKISKEIQQLINSKAIQLFIEKPFKQTDLQRVLDIVSGCKSKLANI